MKKHSIFLGAIFLAVGGFLAKAIGAIYKIPLANILGSNGIGVYYLIFPLYSMLLVLISSGVSVAVSKMIAYERANNNKKNQTTIFKVSLIYVFILALVFSGVVLTFNRQISQLQGNVNAALGYFAIAPAIIFASLISIVRAYFQGLENMIPTSLSNVIEQIVKMVFGLILANAFLDKGVEFAVFGAILAVTISEFVAFLLILANFIFYRHRNKHINLNEIPTSETLSEKTIFKNLIKYSLPATLSSLIIPITSFLDSFMVINLLVNNGYTSVLSTSLYGIQNGIANTLISLPVILTVAISTTIVPNLSSLHAKNNESEIAFKSSFFIKISWLLALPCFVLFIILSPDIIEILYSKGLTDKVISEFAFAYKILMVSSVSILYYAFLQTFTSILQSINKPLIPFISLFVALLIRIVLVIVFIPNYTLNIFGVVIANIIFLSVATLINLIYVRKYIKLNFSLQRFIVVPLVAVIITSVVVYTLKIMLFESLSVLMYTFVCGLVGGIVYISLIWLLRVFSEKEREMFPRVRKIVKNKKV